MDRIKLESAEVAFQGNTHDVLSFRWRVHESVVDQRIILDHNSARIDFDTSVDWRESHKLLKVAFPVDILSSKATYEIPFGAVDRATHTNTTWEQAQFEVCGQRWADLSEAGYGVSLLNDCKYGYDVKGNVLRLSLLRAPEYPDPSADKGRHEFVYSIFPHSGDWRAAHVVRQGYELNHPVQVVPAGEREGTLPQSACFVKLEAQHVVLDTMKPSENGQGTVIRLYESAGGRERVTIRFSISISPKSAEITNLLEENERTIDVRGDSIELEIMPFEVKTLIVTF